jgi:hypothetical protein
MKETQYSTSQNIDHYKYKLYVYVCHIPTAFRDKAVSLYISKLINKRKMLHTICNISTNFSSDKVGTVYLV